jgi:YVTN family beta-propeller protein
MRYVSQVKKASHREEQRMKRLLILAVLLAAVPVAAAPPGVDYHLARTFVLGGSGGWDYLTYDASSHRLFVSRATHVMVVDPRSGTIVGEIANTPGVHGIALAPELKKGFTSNGADGTLTVFNLSTLATIATIQTGAKNPDGIVYDPASARLFTFNGGSNDATVIDAHTNTVVATIPLGGRPEFPAVDGRGMVYDNVESTSEIVAIDARSAKIIARFPLGSCLHPSGLSIDEQNRRLFTACTGEMGVVDADSGKLVATIPTGAGTDATRYDPASRLAFASNGRDATLTVVQEYAPNQFTLVQNATTALGARTMALDPQTSDVYLVTAKLIVNPHPTSYRDRYTVVPGTFELLVMQQTRALEN